MGGPVWPRTWVEKVTCAKTRSREATTLRETAATEMRSRRRVRALMREAFSRRGYVSGGKEVVVREGAYPCALVVAG